MEKLNLNPFGLSGQQYDPVAFAKMKADTINNTPGDLTGHNCPKCLNRGNMAIPKEDGGVSIRECSCMKIRRCVWEMEKSGLKNIIQEKTFEAYTATEPWQKAIKAGAVAYADKLEGWLLFCGQSGSGKTHLCTAVCRHRLLAGDEVRYMPWRDKVAELKAMSLDNDRRAEIINGYKTAQILYIDDLYKVGKAADGSSNPTGADIGLAFEIINLAVEIAQRGHDQWEVICDCAEPKSISDLRDNGIHARACYKAPGCVEYRVKWLQHRKIVIDPRRTPNAHREFVNYAYPVDKNGNLFSQLVDKDNHAIDATAYGLTRVIFSRQYSA